MPAVSGQRQSCWAGKRRLGSRVRRPGFLSCECLLGAEGLFWGREESCSASLGELWDASVGLALVLWEAFVLCQVRGGTGSGSS